MSTQYSDEYKAYEKDEPILSEENNRWVMFPIKYNEIWNFYKKAEASFWTVEEVDLAADMRDWITLTKDEQHFIKHVLAFFAASDGIVLENLALLFLVEVKIPEARAFYGFQAMIENIHSEMYSLLINEYITDPVEKDRLLNGIQTVEAVEKKASWALKWLNNKAAFIERLIAFAAVEGILFSGSFCAIFWLKKRGLMPGLTFSNELISRDEGLHADFACLLYKHMQKPLPAEHIQNIIREAVDVERYFICEALPCDLIGMNSRLMLQYIECVADRLLVSLNVPKIYNSTNPFEWMELISIPGKTNFFEKRVGDYQKAGILASREQQKFNLSEDF